MDSEAPSGDSAGLAGLERAMDAFARAWAGGDIAALETLLSPSYTHNDVFGTQLSRSAWLTYAAQRSGRSTGFTFRDVKVRLFGDTAVVTGFNDISGGGVRNAADDHQHRWSEHARARHDCVASWHHQLGLRRRDTVSGENLTAVACDDGSLGGMKP